MLHLAFRSNSAGMRSRPRRRAGLRQSQKIGKNRTAMRGTNKWQKSLVQRKAPRRSKPTAGAGATKPRSLSAIFCQHLPDRVRVEDCWIAHLNVQPIPLAIICTAMRETAVRKMILRSLTGATGKSFAPINAPARTPSATGATSEGSR